MMNRKELNVEEMEQVNGGYYQLHAVNSELGYVMPEIGGDDDSSMIFV